MEKANSKQEPWVSFCMSTFKRPELLKTQLSSILQQTFVDFEIVVSDNDPDCSARDVVNEFNDHRVKYFSNKENLGMINSFNKSIKRSLGEYVVMITDDDPVVPEMLEKFYEIVSLHPDYGIYCGCDRVDIEKDNVEVNNSNDFVFKLLDPRQTRNLLWSSCLLNRNILINLGGMPNYGSPHLADHALLALCARAKGGVLVNKMFSCYIAHDGNFSKGNIELYYLACEEFYKLIVDSFQPQAYIQNQMNALQTHLERWFITYSFALRKYYSYTLPDQEKIANVNMNAKKILGLPFMKHIKLRYYIKLVIFFLKKPFVLLRIMH